MARISGVTLPKEKKVVIALTYIFGIGNTRARKIVSDSNVDGDLRTKDLSDEQVNSLRSTIEKMFRVEGELKREVIGNIKRLKDIGSYRGARHAKRLPSRGQRSKTNSRTVRGNVRKTAGSGRRAVAKK